MNISTAQECASMSDADLLHILTIDRSDYNARYHETALRELEQRGTSVSQLRNTAHVGFNDEEAVPLSIDQALARLDENMPLWSLLTFINGLDHAWVLQREHSRYLVHHYTDDTYQVSFFFDSTAQIKPILQRFLTLEEWSVEQPHDLNQWKSAFQTRSIAYLTKIASELDDANILHTVKTPLFTGDGKGSLILTVPEDAMAPTREIIADNETKLDRLYSQAERLADHNNRDQELKAYDILTQIVPDNPAVHYNRGSILMELDRPDEAAESFIESVALGLPDLNAQPQLKSRRSGLSRLGGSINPLIGILLSAQQANQPQDKPPQYPDYVDDAEMFLLRILQQCAQDTEILHCLATIAELKTEIATAKQRYRDILNINPNDETAQSNLAFLEHAESDTDG